MPSVPQGYRSPEANQRWIEVINSENREIPPHSAVEVIESYRYDATVPDNPGGRTVVYVRRPTWHGLRNVLITGKQAIPAYDGTTIAYGEATNDYPAYAVWDDSYTAPSFSEIWGTIADSYKLGPGRPGFFVMGDSSADTPAGEDVVRVRQLVDQEDWVIAKNDSGATIPPYALMRIDSVTSENNQVIYVVDIPKELDGNHDQWLINGAYSFADGDYAMASYGVGKPRYCLYNSSYGTPSLGDIWGPDYNSHSLGERGNNYEVIGNVGTLAGYPSATYPSQPVALVQRKLTQAEVRYTGDSATLSSSSTDYFLDLDTEEGINPGCWVYYYDSGTSTSNILTITHGDFYVNASCEVVVTNDVVSVTLEQVINNGAGGLAYSDFYTVQVSAPADVTIRHHVTFPWKYFEAQLFDDGMGVLDVGSKAFRLKASRSGSGSASIADAEIGFKIKA